MNTIPASVSFAVGTFNPSELPPSALGNTTAFEVTLSARQLPAFLDALGDTEDLDVRAGQLPNRRRQVVTVSMTGPGPRILDAINAYRRFTETRH
jgi:hypothetical protein